MAQEHYVPGMTMAGVFYNTVDHFPERIAQVFAAELYGGDNDGQLTWSELRERVEFIAGGLIELGLEKKDRIALAAPNSPYWTAMDLAVTCMGSVLTTIYPTLSLGEIQYIINDSDSKILVVGNEKILERVLPGMDEMPGITSIIVLRMDYESHDPQILSLKDLIQLGRDTAEKNMPIYHQRRESLTMDDWLTMLYTSGTTGQGKGVLLLHKTLSGRLSAVDPDYRRGDMALDQNDRVMIVLPLSHIFERCVGQWMAIGFGASMAYAQSPATLVADLARFEPSWFCCVPRIYEKVYVTINATLSASALKKKMFDWALGVGDEVLQYRKDDRGRINFAPNFDLEARLPWGLKIKHRLANNIFANIRKIFGSNFRFCFSAASGISEHLLLFFYRMGIPVLEGYGLTETTSAVSVCMLNQVKPGSVGPALIGANWRLAEDGEVELSGVGIFEKYLNKPEDTAEAFTEDGWFKTGDIGIVDEDGYYRIVERKKAIICTLNGKNIAPAKVEQLFGTSKYIEQIFVLGDDRNFIAALIVPNYNYFIECYDREGIKYDKDALEYVESNGQKLCGAVGDDFVAHSYLRKRIAGEVRNANHRLEDFERIKQYEILKVRFSEENGQLTPTNKTKKRVIIKDYAELIEEIYARPADHHH
ncbi:MAG: long-chain fatty acid--CoA ligase [Syntrophomonadaceae bacterium]|nr:long-chain fatty acid--CoA ligase [Syntrophomonadaceae bacterium]